MPQMMNQKAFTTKTRSHEENHFQELDCESVC